MSMPPIARPNRKNSYFDFDAVEIEEFTEGREKRRYEKNYGTSTNTITAKSTTVRQSSFATSSSVLGILAEIMVEKKGTYADSTVPTIESPPSTPPKKMKLVSLEELKEKNCKNFIHFFKQTWKTRSASEDCGFRKQWLPSVPHFEKHFYELMSTPDCGLIRKMRIANVTVDTIRRAAASAVFFLVFAKQDQSFKKCLVRETFAHDTREMLIQMSVEEKCEMIGRFINWYDSIIPLRVSAKKFIASKLSEARTQNKEEGTLRTVCRGLLGYFTYVAVIQPSASKAPTDESRRYWASINTSLINCKIRKGGAVDIAPASISLNDLKAKFDPDKSAKSLFEIQSWLLAIILAGTGLRIGSIRNQWKKDFNKTATRVKLYRADNEDAVGSEEEEECAEENDDAEPLDVSFEFMKGNDLVIFRLPSRSDDPPNTVRLRAELSIHSTKTTGQSFFAPQKHGYHHPTIAVDGTEDWGISVALALTLMSVICGATDIVDIIQLMPGAREEVRISKLVSPSIPLFRASNRHQCLQSDTIGSSAAALQLVADSLKIPAALFPSRSYRCGYAKGVVEGVVNRQDSNNVVTLLDIRNALLTSSRWRSNQVDRYLSSITKSVLVVGNTDIGISVNDWNRALADTSLTKSSYQHVSQLEIYTYLFQRTQNKDQFVDTWKNLKKNERRSLMDSVNYENWNNIAADPWTPSEQVKLNVIKIVRSLEEALKSDSLHLPFMGYGRCEKRAPFKCPVINCSSAKHDTIQASCEHWIQCHEKMKKDLKYLCSACQTAGISQHRYFLRHNLLKAAKTNISFRWFRNESDEQL